MDRVEIIEILKEHGTSDQVQWFNNLDDEPFMEVFFSIISEHKEKNEVVPTVEAAYKIITEG